MTQQRAKLTLEANVDPGTSGADTGTFEFLGDLVVENRIQPAFVLGGTGSTFNAIFQSALDRSGDTLDILGSELPQKRAGVYLDPGGGRHVFQLEFRGWDGATDQDGTDLTWGDTSRATGTPANATGETATRQMQVLARYLKQGEFDSRGVNAILSWGEYSVGGLFEGELDSLGGEQGLHVAVEEATMTRREEGAVFDGTLVLAEAVHYANPLDAIWRPDQ